MFKNTAFKYLPLLLFSIILSLLVSALSTQLSSFVKQNWIVLSSLCTILGIYVVLQLRENQNTRRKQSNSASVFLWVAVICLGFVLTIIFLVNGQSQTAIISLVMTGLMLLLPIVGKFITTFLKLILERSDNWQEQLAIELAESIWLMWLTFTSPFQRRYYQSLIYACRDFKTEGFRVGLPVLDLEKVFVPLSVTSEALENISNGIISEEFSKEQSRKNQSLDNQQIWDFLAHISDYRRIAIVAGPGSGKSTLLEHLTLIYARNAHQRQHRKAPKLIPILLYLRNVYEEIISNNRLTLAELTTSEVKKLPSAEKLNPPPDWFEKKLKKGQCLVMLDGLDEIADTAKRQLVSQWLNQQMLRYPETSFILTSRPLGYSGTPIEQIRTVLVVQPFSLIQTKQFIRNWYLQTEIKRNAWKDDPGVRQKAEKRAESLIEDIEKNKPIAAMATNPLLLSMIATVHFSGNSLPARRVELYEKICALVLGERQRAKKIPDRLSAEQKKSVLQVLGLELMKLRTDKFKLSQGSEIIRDKLAHVAGHTFQAETFLKDVEEFSGFIVRVTTDEYKFPHLSFQEYLAAAQVKELGQENLLIENFLQDWWSETIKLYAAQNDATNLIREAFKTPTVKALTLAYSCLEECLSVQPSIRVRLEEIIQDGLESSDPAISQLAAWVLLKRRTQ